MITISRNRNSTCALSRWFFGHKELLLCITEFSWIEYAGQLYFYGGNDTKVGWKDAKVVYKYFKQLGRLFVTLRIQMLRLRFGKLKLIFALGFFSYPCQSIAFQLVLIVGRNNIFSCSSYISYIQRFITQLWCRLWYICLP